MKKNYDVVVVGACTAGVYFAQRMASQGYSVLVAEKLPQKEVGKRLDIIHLDKGDMKHYGVPVPQPGDSDYYHEFGFSASRSALGNHEKHHEHTVMVLDLAGYIARLTDWAEQSGVQFAFGHAFTELVFNDAGKVVGVTLQTKRTTKTVGARLVVDCTGMASAVRKALPEGYGVENFDIDGKSQFYVTCRYIHFKDPEAYPVKNTISWPWYKVWIAPQQDESGALLGVGANLSHDYGEKALADFLDTIKLPEFTVDYIQRGATPYRRPPYSFVADGFVCMGDSACLTKPSNGEGIVAAWYLSDIAAHVCGRAMENGAYPTAYSLWDINVQYQTTQGAKFAELLAQLTGAVDCTKAENDYEFSKDIIFKDQLLNAPPVDKKKETASLVKGLLTGVVMGKIKPVTVKKLLHYASIASNIKKHYRAYPTTPSEFPAWEKKANELWDSAGSMADVLE